MFNKSITYKIIVPKIKDKIVENTMINKFRSFSKTELIGYWKGVREENYCYEIIKFGRKDKHKTMVIIANIIQLLLESGEEAVLIKINGKPLLY